MSNYQNIRLEKSLYNGSGKSFSQQLEQLDPTAAYAGTELGELDAFGRQLKRFDIKVSGPASDQIQKFFQNAETATLFPEYVARAVNTGMAESKVLERIIAAKTTINTPDYRTISTGMSQDDLALKQVLEGTAIPHTTLKLKNTLVQLKKRGRILSASYEAIRFQRLELFTVALRQIGGAIAKSQLSDAVEVLIKGDGAVGAAPSQTTATTTLAYSDLVALWNRMGDYELNTLLVSPDMAVQILNLAEFKNPAAGLDFQHTGKLVTPLGASLIPTGALSAGTVIGLDRRYALEMVVAAEVAVEYDKLIDCQLERAAITSIAGFSKIFPEAVRVLTLKK